MVGVFSFLASWRWGVLLILYFLSASALSRWGARRKEVAARGMVEKGGARDALQVLANGGVFALAALLSLFFPGHSERWMALGAGALASSASDTWATEIGTLVGGTPRSILGGAPVPLGMSGGITTLGTLAAAAGALFVAFVALALAWPTRVALAAIIGGGAGSTLDSLLGATLQQRRWCDCCARATERVIHDCGTSTRRAGGVGWLDNDVVNFVCTAAGGLIALVITG